MNCGTDTYSATRASLTCRLSPVNADDGNNPPAPSGTATVVIAVVSVRQAGHHARPRAGSR